LLSALHQTNALAENTRERQLTFWRLGRQLERLFSAAPAHSPQRIGIGRSR
jgi:hypothetical protein